jgi:hypothetical protein
MTGGVQKKAVSGWKSTGGADTLDIAFDTVRACLLNACEYMVEGPAGMEIIEPPDGEEEGAREKGNMAAAAAAAAAA